MKNLKFQVSNFKFSILHIALIVLMMFSVNAFAELTIKANHDHIKIDFFYHGSTVSVKGESDQGTDLIIKITSTEGNQVLRKKGKAAGFLWMNVGNMEFEHVPNLYTVHSTKKIGDILSPEEMDKYVLGYPALSRHAEITPASAGEEKTTWFNEFVKFKESSRLYASSTGKILTSANNGRQSYYILTDWPYQAPPGQYLVSVYAVKDKQVVEKAETTVLVEQVGIVKTLAGMAKNNAAFYGVISILAALAAGFGVGLIFRKGGGAH
ncbi:MAG: hypothetical protein C4538_05605 [Nitrospiraceae bacterium]|nr:MAG: hypothetical protein C4538_05605 [Nitrospiraceae bacterium]